MLAAVVPPKFLPTYFHKSEFKDCVGLQCIYSKSHCLFLGLHLGHQPVSLMAVAPAGQTIDSDTPRDPGLRVQAKPCPPPQEWQWLPDKEYF